MRALSVAGLAAIGVFEAMKKVIESASASAAKGFNIGVGAATAGMPVREFSAVSQALLTHGNVPEEETQGWLAHIKQFQLMPKTGQPPDPALMKAFGVLGITDMLTATPEQLAEQVAQKFAQEPEALAIAQGTNLGLSPTASIALRNAGESLPGEIAEARKTALTERQVKLDRDLVEVENRLAVARTKLFNDIWEWLDPVLIAATNDLATFVTWLDTLNEKFKDLIATLSGIGDADTNDVMDLFKALGDLLNGNFSKLPGDFGKLSDLHVIPRPAPLRRAIWPGSAPSPV